MVAPVQNILDVPLYCAMCCAAYLANNVFDPQHTQHGPMGYHMSIFLSHQDIAIGVRQSLSLFTGESKELVDEQLNTLVVRVLDPEASQHWHQL
jgi:hypothetical protein